MEKEERLKQELLQKFGFPDESFKSPRKRRIFLDVSIDIIIEVIQYLKNDGFVSLCTITGLDIGNGFQAIYHLADNEGCMINLKLNIPREKPVIQSITSIFEGAVFYERELKDMFGIEVQGLPQGRRYPLPDGWPEDQYPLRKDWKQSGSCQLPESEKE
jgi:membrane-bound hydrogenase subunit beta